MKRKWKFEVGWGSNMLQNDQCLCTTSLEYFRALPQPTSNLLCVIYSTHIYFIVPGCHLHIRAPYMKRMQILFIKEFICLARLFEGHRCRAPSSNLLKEQLLGSEATYSICFKKLQHRKSQNIPRSMNRLKMILCCSLMHTVAKGKISHN